MKIKLKISKDGKRIIGIHNDQFDMSKFGKVTIQRASEVYFSNKLQKWMVDLYINGEVLNPHGWDTRQEALMAEVSYLMNHLPDDVPDKAYNDLSA